MGRRGNNTPGSPSFSISQPIAAPETDHEKTISRELANGMEPIEIVKKYDFTLREVETEFAAYNRLMPSRELRILSRRLLDEIPPNLQPELRYFKALYQMTGYLTHDVIFNLVVAEKQASYSATRILVDSGNWLPFGWPEIRCSRCGQILLAGPLLNQWDRQSWHQLERSHQNCIGWLLPPFPIGAGPKEGWTS
jgi:hypothetical protein